MRGLNDYGVSKMTDDELAECQGCGSSVPIDECIEEGGLVLCEDCYFDRHQKIKACDPWGVRSKKLLREQAGLEGTEGLTEVQKNIYEFVSFRVGATPREIAEKFGLSAREVENQFAILRHCELLKGEMREGTLYVVPFGR